MKYVIFEVFFLQLSYKLTFKLFFKNQGILKTKQIKRFWKIYEVNFFSLFQLMKWSPWSLPASIFIFYNKVNKCKTKWSESMQILKQVSAASPVTIIFGIDESQITTNGLFLDRKSVV